MWQLILLGTLGGTTFTFVIKEILSFYRDKLQIDREYRKLIFSRKLEIAERAMANFIVTRDKIQSLQKAYELVVKKSRGQQPYNFEYINSVLESVSHDFKNLNNEKYFEINSIHLYLDLHVDDIWTDADAASLIEAHSNVQDLDIKYKLAHESFKKSNKKIDPNFLHLDGDYQELEKVHSALMNAYEHAIVNLKLNADAIQKMIIRLRKSIIK